MLRRLPPASMPKAGEQGGVDFLLPLASPRIDLVMGPSSKPPPLRWLAELLGLRPEIKRIVESDETFTRESADDKVQRVYTNAVRKLPDYTPHPDGMKPWAVTITRNVMAEAHRDTKRHQEVFEPDNGHAERAASPGPSPERAAQLKQAMERWIDAMQEMPPAQAAVLWMVVVEERSHEEVGAKLGISEDASKMALSRAREFLRARLGNDLFSVPHPVLVLLFDWVHRLGHVWAFLMAMVFASLAPSSPREPDGELHAVATGAARVVAASAADVAHAAKLLPSFEHARAPVPIMAPPTPKKQTHTPHTPRRPRVDSDTQGLSTSGLSADPNGSSANTFP